MSYCVNCGVELENVQKQCPLCGVEVINPRVGDTLPQPGSFAQTRDEQKKIDRSFWVKFNSIVAAVPIAIILLSNLLHDKALTWSPLVIAGVFMVWTFCTSPFFFRRFDYVKMLLVDFAAVILSLAFMQVMLQHSPWFFYLALPITLFCLTYWLIVIGLIKIRILKGLSIVAALFVFASLVVVLIELLLDIYAGRPIDLLWCWFAAAPCLAIAALLVLLDSNEQVRRQLAKRFHI